MGVSRAGSRRGYSPADEPMVSLENAARGVRAREHDAETGSDGHVLVVHITDPGKRAPDADEDGNVGNDTGDEHGVVVVLVVDEDGYDSENEPCGSRRCATGVDASQALQHVGARMPEP